MILIQVSFLVVEVQADTVISIDLGTSTWPIVYNMQLSAFTAKWYIRMNASLDRNFELDNDSDQ